MSERPPEHYLPLRSVEFQIVLSLSHGARHGYRIIQDAEERGEGRAVPGLATLYRALRRLESEGLIRQVADPAEEDDRRRPYELTDIGRSVASLEARRLAAQLRSAEAAALLGGGGGR